MLTNDILCVSWKQTKLIQVCFNVNTCAFIVYESGINLYQVMIFIYIHVWSTFLEYDPRVIF